MTGRHTDACPPPPTVRPSWPPATRSLLHLRPGGGLQLQPTGRGDNHALARGPCTCYQAPDGGKGPKCQAQQPSLPSRNSEGAGSEARVAGGVGRQHCQRPSLRCPHLHAGEFYVRRGVPGFSRKLRSGPHSGGDSSGCPSGGLDPLGHAQLPHYCMRDRDGTRPHPPSPPAQRLWGRPAWADPALSQFNA